MLFRMGKRGLGCAVMILLIKDRNTSGKEQMKYMVTRERDARTSGATETGGLNSRAMKGNRSPNNFF